MILKKSSERSSITGGAEGISHSRPAAATRPQNVALNLEIFEMLRVISSEKAFQFYHGNRAQLA